MPSPAFFKPLDKTPPFAYYNCISTVDTVNTVRKECGYDPFGLPG